MGFLAVVVFRSTLHPVRQLVAAATALAAGEPVVIPSLSRSDEIGQLAKSLSAWEQASRERLELAQGMVDVGARTELNDLLSLGLRQTAKALDASSVALDVRLSALLLRSTEASCGMNGEGFVWARGDYGGPIEAGAIDRSGLPEPTRSDDHGQWSAAVSR
jgi:HAMP domain-containing protein